MMAPLAKRYCRLKYALSITETIFTLAVLFIFLKSGLAGIWEGSFNRLIPWKFLVLPVFLLAGLALFSFLNLPLGLSGYFLDRKFSLSNQKIKDWLGDQLKAGALSYIFMLILIGVFFYTVNILPHFWWIAISIFWIFFNLILAKLAPLVILPLFFKSQELTDAVLRERVFALAKTMKIKIMNVFEIDFSKKSLKANAAFCGIGRTRRVLLADTLKDKYSQDEVMVILAHEFAHYKLKHIFKLMMFNALITFGLFYLIFRTSGWSLAAFNLNALTQLASLPLALIYFILFGLCLQPAEAYLSRRFEKNADLLALQVVNSKEAFISMMDKLGEQNLADRNPHPIIKFFFFDHPPVDERIAMAKAFQPAIN